MDKQCFEELVKKAAQGGLTAEEEKALEPYRVQNAIIMAAGFSARCKPLSAVVPKGLFVVKGEVLIEREICQLREAGINDIVVVVGYMAEKFEYLKAKFGVTLVYNHEYDRKNNIASIYAARKFLGNSYICCADNYYAKNIFSKYEYESFYACVYTKDYADEYCITEDGTGHIQKIERGGKDKWYTIGATYWSRSFSSKFAALLEEEYEEPEIAPLLIDDFHIRHFGDLPVAVKKYGNDEILEFDTLEEFEAFDPEVKSFYRITVADNLYGRYNGLTRYNGVMTDIRVGRLHFNENLWGPSPKALEVLRNVQPEDLYLYDSSAVDELCLAISKKFGYDYDTIFLHNSGSEMVRSIITLMVGENDNVLLPMPYWSYYPGVVDYRFGKKYFYRFHEDGDKCYHDMDDLMKKAEELRPKMIIITSPAMPSGNFIRPDDLEKVVRNNPESLVYVDQAYGGFVDDPTDVNYFINTYDNVMFARTFSKFYALAGLRLGYAIASKRALQTFWLDLPVMRLPIVTRRVAVACLEDDEYYTKMRKEANEVMDWFYAELSKMENIHPYQSDSNFMYMKVTGVDATAVKDEMAKKGYLFRVFKYENQQFYRINIAPMKMMRDFLEKFKRTIEEVKKR